ncbi:MAG: hypothetical protein AB7G10_24740 [Reyranellaceae bacterium]
MNSFHVQNFGVYTTATASQMNRMAASIANVRGFAFGPTMPSTGVQWRGTAWLDSEVRWGDPGWTWAGSLGLLWGDALWTRRVSDGGAYIAQEVVVVASAAALPLLAEAFVGDAAIREPGLAPGDVLAVQSHGGDLGGSFGPIVAASLSNVRSGFSAATTQAVALNSGTVVNFASGHVVFAVQSANAIGLTFTTVQTVMRGRFLRALAVDGGFAIGWPDNVKFPNDAAPDLATNSGAVDVLDFITLNGGATWVGARFDL